LYDSTASIIYAHAVRLAAAAVVAVALAAAPARAALPRSGIVVPGRSLGGVRLGAPIESVLARWGRGFGVCRGCSAPTWYFNYVPFQPQGTGAVFAGTRVDELFTLWSPPGWRTQEGLAIGDPAVRVTALYGPLERQECAGYYRLLLPRAGTTTTFSVVADRVWGFGINRGGSRPCR
jgi:hypothetical protein